MLLPGRRPLTDHRAGARRFALAAVLPAGYTRLLVPAYAKERGAPDLPLFGYAFACVVDDRLHVAAVKTDESDDWQPAHVCGGRTRSDDRAAHRDRSAQPRAAPGRALLARLRMLHRPERLSSNAVKPRCRSRRNATPAASAAFRNRNRDAELPSPQVRIAYEVSGSRTRPRRRRSSRARATTASFRSAKVRRRAAACARSRSPQRDRLIRAARSNGTINLNTNGSCRARSNAASTPACTPSASA